MNPNLAKLQPYPFEKLASLKSGVQPPGGLPHIPLSIGEPRHPAPQFVCEELISHLHALDSYPTTRGLDALRETIAGWLSRRFGIAAATIDPQQHVLPVSGTREALFAFAQAMIDSTSKPVVAMPNPFYQIYEGAALLAGGQPVFLNTTAETRYLPDVHSVPQGIWKHCQLLYLCSPGNPTGAVLDEAALIHILELADKYDFIVAADECYSEIYPDEANPPPGLLQAAVNSGRTDFRRCVAFHSLSKRSNLPGLRSGFVAGDAQLLAQFLKYRTYHGCAIPVPSQQASIKAWGDENHVLANRDLYRLKFDQVLQILEPVMDVYRPDAGFYLWPRTPVDDESFARGLFEQQNVTVLPGSYLSRVANGVNPGADHVRMALVAPLEDCVEAAQRIRRYVNSLSG